MSNDIPKEDTDELRDILTLACWHFSDKFGYEDIYESGRLTEFLDEVESYALQRSREAEIAMLDRLENEFDRHAEAVELWGMKGLVLDSLARTGELSEEQKIERADMVTERRALAVLHGSIKRIKAELTKKREENSNAS